jgi:hypothetical protein
MVEQPVENVQQEQTAALESEQTQGVAPAPEQAPKKKKEKVNHVKNVNLKQCFFIIIGAILGAILFLAPATFGNSFTFLYEYVPFISSVKEFDLTSATLMMQGFSALIKLDESIITYLLMAYSYAPFVYVGILAADILFALLLLITRSQILRVIFKILSILFALVMFVVALLYLVYIVGFAGLIIHAIIKVEELMTALDTSGILVALAFVVFGFIYTGKQLKWFARLY